MDTGPTSVQTGVVLRLNLDGSEVSRCRELAGRIAADTRESVARFTTVSTERTILRLFGLDGIDDAAVPLPNRVIERMGPEALGDGVAFWVGQVMAGRGCDFESAIQQILTAGCPKAGADNWRDPLDQLAARAAGRIQGIKSKRNEMCSTMPPAEPPWFYCIVATGNIHEDTVQAVAAARQGAQVIAVIRSTAQSLLDYVPYGPTTEGFAGTFATQANFRIMREALDEVGEELRRYIFLCNYCSGLCMPEIAAMGALERLDMMLNDAMYGIIFRDINMIRTLTDQFFSRRINGWAGIIINTGEDNYMKTDEGLRAAHTVLASQFINEQLAALCGVPEEQRGLGHAFELDPALEDGFLLELAHALLSREIFPHAPLKYMPPTRYKSGDIFRGYLQDGLFNIVSLITRQHIQLLGMLTEAVRTPGLHDRYLALENARYIRHNLKHLGDEIQLIPDGIIQRRAKRVLSECRELLEEIAGQGLQSAVEKGIFGGIARRPEEGRGLDGVVEKSARYYNPFEHVFSS